MIDQNISHDRAIAKIQHFWEILKQQQRDKEAYLLTIDRDCDEKEKLKNQIFLLEELNREYYNLFYEIIYR